MIRTARSSSIARSRASDLRARPWTRQRLGDLIADAHHRVQRGHRLLKDEADAGAADVPHLVLRQRQQIASLEEHAPAGDATRAAAAAAGSRTPSPTCRCRIRRPAPASRPSGSRTTRRPRRRPGEPGTSNTVVRFSTASSASLSSSRDTAPRSQLHDFACDSTRRRPPCAAYLRSLRRLRRLRRRR